jgi:hypothetical protein
MELNYTKKDWKKYNAVQLGITLQETFLVQAGDCQIIVNKINRGQDKTVTKEEAEANARLVAAAPKLLKAVLATKDFFDDMPKGQFANVVCNVGLMNDMFVGIEDALKGIEE